MLETISHTIQALLGLGSEAEDLTTAQMALRTIIIYIAALVIIRLASRRFLSKASAFDVVVGIMLGSIMSRAINGSAAFWPTIAASAILIGMHWAFAELAYKTGWFGPIVKGDRIVLIKDGEIQRRGMHQASVTRDDLSEAIRLQTRQTDPSRIRLAYMERSGDISVIPYEQEPRVLEVAVEAGVKTVRIELD